jgi:DNA-binding LacI/PurR family transcriptional regulator
MSHPNFSTIRTQLANHLREEICRGRWTDTMPGRDRLAKELGINRKTVEAALNILEKDGLLVSQGPGRRRRIALPKGGLEVPPLRVAILRYGTPEGEDYHVRLRQYLSDAGHEVLMPGQSYLKQRLGSSRLARMVRETEADAWVVIAGSREELEWFTQRPEPVFTLFGARRGLPIAGCGPDHEPAMLTAVRRLVSLGHRRIALLVREAHRRLPLERVTQSFLDELETQGIATSSYNLPEWQETPEGLRQCLDSLFKTTPPSALIIDEPFLFAATQQHLTRRGFHVPEHVSMVCIDSDPTFEWFHPSVAHLAWDQDQVLKRVLRWTNNVASGKDDRRQSYTKAKFVDGGTVGVAPKS